MNFKQFSDLVSNQFTKIADGSPLFKSTLSGDTLWDIYLNSFTEQNNPVFRDPESSTHNCNLDKNFIRRYGNVVALDESLKIVTIWDVEITPESQFYDSVQAMKVALKEAAIKDIFMETFIELKSLPYEACKATQETFRLGIETNHKMYSKEEANQYGVVEEGKVYEFNHFYANLPKVYVSFTDASIESIRAEHRDAKNVFKRGLDEIPADTLQLVRELIGQGSLLDAESHLYKIDAIQPLKVTYDTLENVDKDNYTWLHSRGLACAKFRNELLGVLCTDIATGMDLTDACTQWNKRVDPANYMKAVAPITEAQREQARKFVEENGYTESFDRRFATLDDINISEIMHVGNHSGEVKKASIFDKVVTKPATRHKKSELDGVEEVTIDKFMSEILPNCTSVMAMVENRMMGNFVTITTANNPDSKGIFKWDNNYSYTYNGNLAGKTQLTEMVEAKGGRTDGVFRFTHSWNELERNQSLMDLHVFLPGSTQPADGHHDNYGNTNRVGWNHRVNVSAGGQQDVDYTLEANLGYVPVENITFSDLNLLKDGVYTCKIHNWDFRKTGGRGKAEISFQGEVYGYTYPSTKNREWVTIANVTLKNGVFTIEHVIQPDSEVSADIWGIKTQDFHKVNLVSLSPNHWGKNSVGNKHFFFMLEGCKPDTPMRSFHNENLNSDLVPHRKVMDVLGTTLMLEPTDNQLAGLGFNATVRDELIVKVEGSFKRMLKIKF